MAQLVADELRKFCIHNLELLEDEVAALTPEDCETCLKLLLASQIRNQDLARFVCTCIDPARVYALKLNQDARIDPKFYAYVFNNAHVNDKSTCLKYFGQVLGGDCFSSSNELLRIFHAQNVNNFRDEVLSIAQGNVSIGNQLYTTLRSLSEDVQPLEERVADLWQHDVSFPFFADGRVVVMGTQTLAAQVAPKPEKKIDRVPQVPIAHACEVTHVDSLVESLKPTLQRYSVESKLPKHYWNNSLTLNQCMNVALGSTENVQVHRDQTRAHVQQLKFAVTQEELAKLLEIHFAAASPARIAEVVRENVQTRLYNAYVRKEAVVNNPCAFLATMVAQHAVAPQTLPDRYRELCPKLEPVIQELLK